eukprot:TRINITY_DN4195_c0_g2_i1.p1 TRINITY_DN4195_c0_g2~~TRINITY_DN4195_c0_g2_i1.p1  ORF type:complete len:299 (+),score=68.08 TRINITY_DN4195_c0_g2_i1:189-1085(+)
MSYHTFSFDLNYNYDSNSSVQTLQMVSTSPQTTVGVTVGVVSRPSPLLKRKLSRVYNDTNSDSSLNDTLNYTPNNSRLLDNQISEQFMSGVQITDNGNGMNCNENGSYQGISPPTKRFKKSIPTNSPTSSIGTTSQIFKNENSKKRLRNENDNMNFNNNTMSIYDSIGIQNGFSMNHNNHFSPQNTNVNNKNKKIKKKHPKNERQVDMSFMNMNMNQNPLNNNTIINNDNNNNNMNNMNNMNNININNMDSMNNINNNNSNLNKSSKKWRLGVCFSIVGDLQRLKVNNMEEDDDRMQM